ncbi:PemK-like, MazF-like toxin of type II toxin-antitoxin system [Pseudobutyrivibrio sp. YE44]|uniref:type II toxin-antitoxin system PemK/MazF family toxin n=1 Tax=Pseudobutyrivibrio sp. YE44 TaxID=1520802 RepID=UPI00088F5D1D|nr:type II toxin-antitoxin system PemK/MazF family toxin [Pseudobutyrivibrio sp. YE44]SDB56452.1 PemK-like, MazF-like toxin of type II toxin-antitoxin system [Pseudobutyrivibrio sp. YE44]
MVEQGDILKIEKIPDPIVVISKTSYNETGRIIACPILNNSFSPHFDIEFKMDNKSVYVSCDNVKQLDLKPRFYSKKGTIPVGILLNIIERIEAIIDYY